MPGSLESCTRRVRRVFRAGDGTHRTNLELCPLADVWICIVRRCKQFGQRLGIHFLYTDAVGRERVVGVGSKVWGTVWLLRLAGPRWPQTQISPRPLVKRL